MKRPHARKICPRWKFDKSLVFTAAEHLEGTDILNYGVLKIIYILIKPMSIAVIEFAIINLYLFYYLVKYCYAILIQIKGKFLAHNVLSSWPVIIYIILCQCISPTIKHILYVSGQTSSFYLVITAVQFVNIGITARLVTV